MSKKAKQKKKKISKSKSKSKTVSGKIRCLLWGRAAGRCEFEGCNKALSWNSNTKDTANIADVAHIIGFSKDGPRGEEELSKELAKDIDNLMLLCKEDHKNVDENKEKYNNELLRQFKESHECRVGIATEISIYKQSHILLYQSNIGVQAPQPSYNKATEAMFPDWYPADRTPISLGVGNSTLQDSKDSFWKYEREQLESMVEHRVRPRIANGEIKHLSICAFATQPLLMYLGFLLSDIPAAEVYQLHREPPNWKWQEHPDGFKYIIQEPDVINGPPALIIALSATINDDRITSVLGEKATIWRVTHSSPNNDYLKSRKQLQQFREIMRRLMDCIKAKHGENAVLHVFPSMPVATAVEMGRLIMPKADLPLKVYDQNPEKTSFIHVLNLDAGSRL